MSENETKKLEAFLNRVVRDITIEDRVQIAMGLIGAAEQVRNISPDRRESFEKDYPGLTFEQAKAHGEAIKTFAMLFALKLAHKPLPQIMAKEMPMPTGIDFEKLVEDAIKAHESGTCGCGHEHGPLAPTPGKKAQTIH
jgi:hypothetical protein